MPSPRVQIRQATVADVPLIFQLVRELAEYERMVDDVKATEDALRNTLFGARPAAEVLLAYLDGEPVGYSLFFQNYSTFMGKPGLYIEDLFVRPTIRGAGVGRALMKRLAEIAVERGYGRAEWIVLDWNTSAKGFYEKLGARHNAKWDSYTMPADALAKLASDA